MLIQNKSKHNLQHSAYNEKMALEIVEIKTGEVKEVKDSIAKKWLKTGLVVEYVEPKQAKALEDENKELKAKIAELEKAAKDVEPKQTKAKAAKK